MELLQGTLDLLVLRTLSAGERLHGYAVQRRLAELSGGRLQVEEGSLYPALYRLEHRGWIRSAWGRSENNRKARLHHITPAGRRQLAAERREWEEFSGTVGAILGEEA
ncbi:MAG: PadR family transcriptional regulator [Terriglobales bacterium]